MAKPRKRVFWLACLVWSFGQAAEIEANRFVVDDAEFLDKISGAARALEQAGKLVSLESLQCQVNRHYFQMKPAALEQKRLAPPELYDRLRESTFAIGDFYLCSSCTNWHFDAATAFAVASNGILSTSFHVVGSGADDPPGKPDFLIAADQHGRVYPVREVLAADPDSDTCLLKIDATGLRPLPIRSGVRVGERVYCLSHPEGNVFMFTEGMVARLMRNHEVMAASEPDGGPRPKGRPTLYVNITAEFSPGSSGGPITDEAGNVVAQVQSIASGVETDIPAGTNSNGGFVSGPVRYCVAAEEILRLTQPSAGYVAPAPLARPAGFTPDPSLSAAQIVEELRNLLKRGQDALEKMDAPLIGSRIFKRFDAYTEAYESQFAKDSQHWEVILLKTRAHRLRLEHHIPVYLDDAIAPLKRLLTARAPTAGQKTEASHLIVALTALKVGEGTHLATWERLLDRHLAEHPDDPAVAELQLKHLELVKERAPSRLPTLAAELSASTNAGVAAAASSKVEKPKRRRPKKP